jgi:hypothetical protein
MPGRLAQTVMSLLHTLEDAGLDPEQWSEFLLVFLASEEAVAAPRNDIGALLMASLARKAASGQKRIPSGGVWSDLSAIASYLPYCDAMFIDDEFAALLTDEPVRSRLAAYPARIFSNRTAADFVTFVHALIAAAPAEHVDLVHSVYGPAWDTPYRTMLADHRERESRRATGA